MSQQVLEICLDWPSLGREELDMHSDWTDSHCWVVG
jgi:hypothetical protein